MSSYFCRVSRTYIMEFFLPGPVMQFKGQIKKTNKLANLNLQEYLTD